MTVSAEDLQWFSERYREITDNIEQVIQGELPTGSVPQLWDGNISQRVVKSIRTFLWI